MDTRTGQLYRGTDDDMRLVEEQTGRTLMKLTPLEYRRLKKLTNPQRVAWAKHRLAPLPEETPEQKQSRKNADKRARRQRASK